MKTLKCALEDDPTAVCDAQLKYIAALHDIFQRWATTKDPQTKAQPPTQKIPRPQDIAKTIGSATLETLDPNSIP